MVFENLLNFQPHDTSQRVAVHSLQPPRRKIPVLPSGEGAGALKLLY